MPKIFFVLIFTLLSLPGFSQEGKEAPPQETPPAEIQKEALTPGSGQVIIRHNPDAVESSDGMIDPDAPPAPNEDAAVEELEKAREAQLKKIEMVQGATEAMKPKNPIKELQELGHKQLNAVAIMDSKVQAVLQRMIKEGHMSRIPADQLKAKMLENVKGTFWEKVFTRFPMIVDISVEVLRDKDALSGLLGIMIRKDDLKTYGYIWLAIFVFAALIKNRIIKPKWPFFKRMAFSMTISLLLTCTSLALFYNFFSEELNPTIKIIGKHF